MVLLWLLEFSGWQKILTKISENDGPETVKNTVYIEILTFS